ncbi:MAG: sulfatase [Verrucomicrobiota bacterium]|nr:sulfatase [Verrucomicrobiota bacterium]
MLKKTIFYLLIGITCLSIGLLKSEYLKEAEQKPNFIIIFTDDQGYNDLSCFGSDTIKTPNLDLLAEQGRKFTSFYVASPVCTPSRAALLTGSYPRRIDMDKGVIFPQDNHGLHTDELTIADMLKEAGYATACIGKWHLGHRKPFLPTNQGFDTYFGIPYSNDMNHPDNSGKEAILRRDESWMDQDTAWKRWKTPLMQDDAIIELPVNQRTITRRYTDRAIAFITANKEKPFFLYLPHSMPHVPLFVPEDVVDSDPANAYANTIEHMDIECGRLIEAVKALGLSQNTYIIFTSDNGPWNGSWIPFNNHAGSAAPLRDGKGTTYEGGQRVPTIMWAPGRIPAGTETNEIASTIDLLPTIAAIAGVELNPRGKIDGVDICNLIHGKGKSPRSEFLYYSRDGKIEGLRQGDWKLRMSNNRDKKPTTVELYNLVADIAERVNLAEQHPGKVVSLARRMRELDTAISKDIRLRGKLDK